MTTLQEAARKALEALKTCSYGDYSAKHVVDPSFDGDAVEAAIESLKAALAQQELPQKERPDFMAGYDAGMADAKRMAQQGEQPIGYVRTINGAPTPDDDNTIFSYGANPYRDVMDKEEWVAVYTAAPSPRAQEPVKFLADGMRFKTSEFPYGVCINGLPKNLAGRWVALVAAEDDCHLQSTQPEDGCAPNHMCNGHRVHIPTGECCNKCGATSW